MINPIRAIKEQLQIKQLFLDLVNSIVKIDNRIKELTKRVDKLESSEDTETSIRFYKQKRQKR